MLDADKDIAYVLLTNELRANYEGWSQMLLPPDVPTRVDLFWEADDRLEMIRIENASNRLSREVLAAAEPFVPLV
jgi:hypothetical protein